MSNFPILRYFHDVTVSFSFNKKLVKSVISDSEISYTKTEYSIIPIFYFYIISEIYKQKTAVIVKKLQSKINVNIS